MLGELVLMGWLLRVGHRRREVGPGHAPARRLVR
jgi:hypothetical protein